MLVLMQGVPGSGKSTAAKKLGFPNSVIYSTDEFFMVDGVYCFDPELLSAYHEVNQLRTEAALREGKTVIVDNCNIQRSHAAPYMIMARSLGLQVLVLQCNGEYENVHNVPPGIVQRMRENMEYLL